MPRLADSFDVCMEMGHQVQVRHGSSPGLEVVAWSQFLVNYQAIWWGHANIRWEWRLATMIPSDIYGATIETTMADVKLLAALPGMSFSSSPGVIARTKCGEMLTKSQHMVLGAVVYYRSGRENIAPKITMKVPCKSSTWLHCLLEMQNHLKAAPSFSSTSTDDSKQHEITTLLSRPRTEYDAQLPLSLGNLSCFSTTLFTLPWKHNLSSGPPPALSLQAELKTYPPVVSGSQSRHEVLTPGHWSLKSGAKVVKSTRIVGPIGCFLNPTQTRTWLRGSLGREIEIQTRSVCLDFAVLNKNCAAVLCKCPGGPATIARAVKTTGSFEVLMAVAAVNNDFLGRVGKGVLGTTARELAGWVCKGDQNDRGLRREVTGCIQRALEAGGEEGVVVEGSLELVKVVIANTEVVLRGVRRGLGVGEYVGW